MTGLLTLLTYGRLTGIVTSVQGNPLKEFSAWKYAKNPYISTPPYLPTVPYPKTSLITNPYKLSKVLKLHLITLQTLEGFANSVKIY